MVCRGSRYEEEYRKESSTRGQGFLVLCFLSTLGKVSACPNKNNKSTQSVLR